MEAFNRKITVNKEVYKEARHEEMSQSLEDAFNHILSNFTDAKKDERYNDGLHQILTNSNGSQYYFDSFKYIYSLADKTNVAALNNNIGRGKMCRVITRGDQLIIENYDFDNQSVEVELANMTERTKEYISKYFKNSLKGKSEFVFQVSGGFAPCIETLEKCTKININKNDNGMLICTNDNGDVLEQVLVGTNNSFYEDCTECFDYYNILSKQLEKGRQR